MKKVFDNNLMSKVVSSSMLDEAFTHVYRNSPLIMLIVLSGFLQENTGYMLKIDFKTLKKHKQDIYNYFINRNSSGFVEGFNNKAKVLKRSCYGITNLKHLFQRLFLDFSGYNYFATNSKMIMA